MQIVLEFYRIKFYFSDNASSLSPGASTRPASSGDRLLGKVGYFFNFSLYINRLYVLAHMKKNIFYSSFDFVSHAKRNLPSFVFDFIEGGAGNELAVACNSRSFDGVKFIPSIRSEKGNLSLSSKILDLDYAAPFGVAPLGLCGLVHPNADIILAKAAAKFNVPYIASAAASQSISAIAQAAGTPPWFQLYIPKAGIHLSNLLQKAAENACPVLVVTVDTPSPGRRLRDLRNRLKLPYSMSFEHIIESVRHPVWSVRRLLNGGVKFPNYDGTIKSDIGLTFRDLMDLQTSGDLNWEVIQNIRDKWTGKMVLKGILSVYDAIQSQKIGIDAVIMSNHGGRQLNLAPSPISMLPLFTRSGLKSEFLMLDSGIRSGDDIFVSLASGAGFTFMGRPFLYALAANGSQGVEDIFNIVFDELLVNLKLLGLDNPKEIRESKRIVREI